MSPNMKLSMDETRYLADLDLEQIQELLVEWGEPKYRATQIWQGFYKHLHASPEEIPNLPRALRQRLAESFSFSHLNPVNLIHSTDGETSKTLFELPDAQAIEAVLMRYQDRRTLCISTQAGCAMGCVFCATGQMGFRRNLTSGEILEQVLYYARILKSQDEQVTNVGVRGMGGHF